MVSSFWPTTTSCSEAESTFPTAKFLEKMQGKTSPLSVIVNLPSRQLRIMAMFCLAFFQGIWQWEMCFQPHYMRLLSARSLKPFGEVRKMMFWFVRIANTDMFVLTAVRFPKESIRAKENILQLHIRDVHTILTTESGQRVFGEWMKTGNRIMMKR